MLHKQDLIKIQMKHHAEAWRDNLVDQVREVKSLLNKYYFSKDAKIGNELAARLAQLKLCFAKGREPVELVSLAERVEQFRGFPSRESLFHQMMEAGSRIETIVNFKEEDIPSLDQIFDRHKSNDTLNQLIDDLCAKIEEFLREADSEMSARLNRELHTILSRFKNRSKLSLIEVRAWADLAAGALIEATESHLGLPGLKIAYEGAKIAYKVRKNLAAAFSESRKDMLEMHRIDDHGAKLLLDSDSTYEVVIESKLLELGNSEDK